MAYPLGLALLERIKRLPGVVRAELCGSLRRRRETAKDIDIVVGSADPKPILAGFVAFPEVVRVTAHGDVKASAVASLTLGTHKVTLNADLLVVPDELFAFAVHHFTGSKDHNKRLRPRAQDMGLTLSEHGLVGKGKPLAAETEADIYKVLGLAFVPPELREDTGEIEAAEKGELPTLVEAGDLRGVFHNHTTSSDGANTLEEMALATKALGWEYFGVADHSQSLKVARGLSPAAVEKQQAEIDAVNARLRGVRILKGIECDILDDGSLDYADELLGTFDYVVVSVHTLFNLPSDEMTARVCKALSHPATTMLGHATGRLLLRRDGYKIDLDEVLKAAAKHGKMVEINAQPSRLDLDWTWCKKAKGLGIPIAINPDAHSTDELGLVEFGINVARRGWLTKDDVFNTRPLADVMRELARRKATA